MAIGIAAVLFVLLLVYFIWQTSKSQDLSLDFSSYTSPTETVVETELDVAAPIDSIWKTLTKLADYHLWFPWVRKVRVTNSNVDRWAQRHSFQHYRVEVGSYFKIRPFILSPLTRCRFIALDPHKRLALEMRFFPFNKEIVTFTLNRYSNLVELTYSSINKGIPGLITAIMFSWRGKQVLRSLGQRLPEVPVPAEPEVDVSMKEEPVVMDEAFINALVAKALGESMDVINNLTDRPIRAKAKSAYIKAERSGQVPDVTPESEKAVEQFLGVGGPAKPREPVADETHINELVSQALAGDEDVIDQAVEKALSGNMDAINTISDRIIRSKAKSAYMKAKRQKK